MKMVWKLLRDTVRAWSADRAAQLAAALAYYAVISLAPIVLLIFAVVGVVYNDDAVRRYVLLRLEEWVGSQSTSFLRTVLENTQTPALDSAASLLSIGVLLWGSTNLFHHLRLALNLIWKVAEQRQRSLWKRVIGRLLAFLMVLGVGFLLIVLLLLSTLLVTVSNYLDAWLPGQAWWWPLLSFGFSLLVITLLFALVYKAVPDAEIAWRDVWVGAGATALLFVVGNFLLSLYLSRQTTPFYGAASSLIAFLLWVYFSAQIFFLGAEFTRVYANRYGAGIEPETEGTRSP